MGFAEHLAGLIRQDGPMRLDRFMALSNAHYYATRDPFGAAGDFITAPEISQLFGEMIGLCLVDFWERSGAPSPFRLVELGPGRGTLMADLLRAARVRPAFDKAARIALVETSPALRARQREALAGHEADWFASFAEVPDDAPLYLVANEFFDALPIRQFVRDGARWMERVVVAGNDGLGFALLPAAPPAQMLRHGSPGSPLRGARRMTTSLSSSDTPKGRSEDPCLSGSGASANLLERNEAAAQIAADIGARLSRAGGIALVLDYGHLETAFGDTLQAVKSHKFSDLLAHAGEADLTAHVDFQALAEAAGVAAVATTQGGFLGGLGIDARAAALTRARPDQANAIAATLARLIAPDQMGTLFKAMALTGPGAPVPAGFAP
jgi:NADH dehydrogenase [ubiquinone] 1 alpha subcomplex assembly factor 7